MVRVSVSVAALLLLCTRASTPLVGQGDDGESRKSLAGLQGVYLAVSVPEEVQRHGVSETQLRTDVELRLRQAGIRVLSPEEAGDVPGVPYLYLTVGTLAVPSLPGLYAFVSNLELVQSVYLGREPSVHTLGRTWNATGTFGTVGQNNLETTLRQKARDLADQFINAFLAANPKR